MIETDILQAILRDSNYNLSLFSDGEVEALRQKAFSKEVRGKETPFINCIIRDRGIQLKPEEVIRQLYAKTFSHALTYDNDVKSIKNRTVHVAVLSCFA